MTPQLSPPKPVAIREPEPEVVLAYAKPLPGWTGRLFKYVPAFDSLRQYSWRAFSADLLAGISVATVAVPQAMAYGMLALSDQPGAAQIGFFTAIVMTTVGALFDSSRQLINGPTNAIAIALLSALAVIPPSERVSAAILIGLMVGLTQLTISVLGLGDLTRFVSHSVIVGFTAGASTLLVINQMKDFFGFAARGDPAKDHLMVRSWLSLTEGGGIHWPTFFIGAGTIAIVVYLRKFNEFWRRRGARFPIPQHLVAVVIMSTLVWTFELYDQGVKIVGSIPRDVLAFQVPEVKWEQVQMLSGSAFAIALLGMLEAVAMAKAIASRSGQRLDINQQCLSEGAANLAGSFFMCIPGSGSLTRSAINVQVGAVSQWSGVFSAVAVAATVLLFAPLAQYIPRAALAGLLMLAAFRMVDGKQILFHWRASRLDASVVAATAMAALAINVEYCIIVGVFLSFVLYVPRAAQVRMVQLTRTPDHRIREWLPTDPPCNQLLCVSLEGNLFFGSEHEFEKHLAAIEEQAERDKIRVVVLVLKGARNPDAAFLQYLYRFYQHLERQNVVLLLCGVQSDLGDALAATGLESAIGERHIFHARERVGASTTEAIQFAYGLLGDNVCATCPRKQQGAVDGQALHYDI